MTATRRTFLGGIAASSIPSISGAALRDDAPPTRDELDRYYTFLWLEFIALSQEMGVEMHSHYVMNRSGGRDEYLQKYKISPPSGRAKAVLEAVNR